MYLKGIDKYTVEDALEIYKDNVELRILELINKKYKKYLNSEDENSKYKLKNALVRQGYTYDEVNRAISMMDSTD
jgi:regulatory protein